MTSSKLGKHDKQHDSFIAAAKKLSTYVAYLLAKKKKEKALTQLVFVHDIQVSVAAALRLRFKLLAHM